MRIVNQHAILYLQDMIHVLEHDSSGWKSIVITLPDSINQRTATLTVRHLEYLLEHDEGSLFFIEPDEIVILFHGQAEPILKKVRAALQAYLLHEASIEAFDVSIGWQKLQYACLSARLNQVSGAWN